VHPKMDDQQTRLLLRMRRGLGGGTGTGGRSAQGWRAARISAPYGPQCYTTGCSKRGGGGGFLWPSRQSQHQTQNRAPDGVFGDRGPERRSSTDGRSVPPHRLPLLRKRSRTYIRTGVIMSLFGQTSFLCRPPTPHGSQQVRCPICTRTDKTQMPKKGPHHDAWAPRYGAHWADMDCHPPQAQNSVPRTYLNCHPK